VPAAAALILAATLSRALGDELLSGCTAAERQTVLHTADTSPLGTAGGRRVVLVSVHGSCVCGTVNCPYVVLRLAPDGTADVLLNTFAYEVAPTGPAAPLPNLRELAHDSALVSDETVDAYRNGKYVVVSSARIRGDNGARKANAVPVHFAAGTTSTVLSGSVSLGWYDEYALAAAAGQRITVSEPHASGTLTFTLVDRDGAHAVDIAPGVAAVLPRSGVFLLHVEGSGEAAESYRATVTIR
jgi:hypothetical protein